MWDENFIASVKQEAVSTQGSVRRGTRRGLDQVDEDSYYIHTAADRLPEEIPVKALGRAPPREEGELDSTLVDAQRRIDYVDDLRKRGTLQGDHKKPRTGPGISQPPPVIARLTTPAPAPQPTVAATKPTTSRLLKRFENFLQPGKAEAPLTSRADRAQRSKQTQERNLVEKENVLETPISPKQAEVIDLSDSDSEETDKLNTNITLDALEQIVLKREQENAQLLAQQVTKDGINPNYTSLDSSVVDPFAVAESTRLGQEDRVHLANRGGGPHHIPPAGGSESPRPDSSAEHDKPGAADAANAADDTAGTLAATDEGRAQSGSGNQEDDQQPTEEEGQQGSGSVQGQGTPQAKQGTAQQEAANAPTGPVEATHRASQEKTNQATLLVHQSEGVPPLQGRFQGQGAGGRQDQAQSIQVPSALQLGPGVLEPDRQSGEVPDTSVPSFISCDDSLTPEAPEPTSAEQPGREQSQQRPVGHGTAGVLQEERGSTGQPPLGVAGVEPQFQEHLETRLENQQLQSLQPPLSGRFQPGGFSPFNDLQRPSGTSFTAWRGGRTQSPGSPSEKQRARRHSESSPTSATDRGLIDNLVTGGPARSVVQSADASPSADARGGLNRSISDPGLGQLATATVHPVESAATASTGEPRTPLGSFLRESKLFKKESALHRLPLYQPQPINFGTATAPHLQPSAVVPKPLPGDHGQPPVEVRSDTEHRQNRQERPQIHPGSDRPLEPPTSQKLLSTVRGGGGADADLAARLQRISTEGGSQIPTAAGAQSTAGFGPARGASGLQSGSSQPLISDNQSPAADVTMAAVSTGQELPKKGQYQDFRQDPDYQLFLDYIVTSCADPKYYDITKQDLSDEVQQGLMHIMTIMTPAEKIHLSTPAENWNEIKAKFGWPGKVQGHPPEG